MSRHGRRGRYPHAQAARPARQAPAGQAARPGGDHAQLPAQEAAAERPRLSEASSPTRATVVPDVHQHPRPAIPDGAARAESPTPAPPGPDGESPGRRDDRGRPGCTVPQLRRFIKSRPWVPMHELRRRFGIAGVDDDVVPIRVRDQRLYVGLPEPEGRLLAELLSGGDVGYQLSLDPGAPVVIGVYPMRPVPRG